MAGSPLVLFAGEGNFFHQRYTSKYTLHVPLEHGSGVFPMTLCNEEGIQASSHMPGKEKDAHNINIGIMEKKMETIGIMWFVQGL